MEELESIGLAAPQVTYVMRALRRMGWDVSQDVTTQAEAADEILEVLRKAGMEC